MVSIPDPTLNPTTVQLLRINTDGSSSLIAQMNDTGKNGDQKPGDKTFTAQFTLNELRPSTFSFEVTADFRGKDLVRSAPQQFAVLAQHNNPVVLPPDPGDAGKTTIAGLDSDHDGVRDDLQRYIILTYPQSETERAGLIQLAKADQDFLITTTPADALIKANTGLQAKDCLYYTLGGSDVLGGIYTGETARHALEAQLLNTRERSAAWLNANHIIVGQQFNQRATENNSTGCMFDISRMSN